MSPGHAHGADGVELDELPVAAAVGGEGENAFQSPFGASPRVFQRLIQSHVAGGVNDVRHTFAKPVVVGPIESEKRTADVAGNRMQPREIERHPCDFVVVGGLSPELLQPLQLGLQLVGGGRPRQHPDVRTAVGNAVDPLREFMVRQTREKDLALMLEIAHAPQPESIESVKTVHLVPAFLLSELKTAFQIGFVIFLPFLLLDLVVASVLMSMGMLMVPPTIISLPLKVLMFVLIDGWGLVVRALLGSFH